MTSHHVAMATLWRSRRRADLVPGTAALAQEVVWLLADLWDEREDGLAERADVLGDRLRDALRARGADAQHDLNGLLGLVLIALGLLARDAGDRPRDETLFAEGLETSPSHASPLHALALLHTGRAEEAGRILAELSTSADPHAAYAQALLTRQQDPHLTLKQLEAACARWEHDLKLARLRHDLAERLGKLTPQVWSGLGRALSAAGHYAEAIPALRRSELDDAPTFELLATAYESLGELEHAAPMAARAADLLSSAELHLRAADAYVATGGHAQAARQVDKALEAADEHAVRFAAAQILLATGDMPRALELIREVRADLPGEPRALAVEGIALFGVRDYDAAQRILTRAHESLPGEPVVLRHLAVTQFNLNRLDLAGPLLNQALDLDPDDGWMLAVRGDLRRRLVDLPGAREDLERAHRAGFEEAWTLRLLAQVIEADDPDRALRLLDRSLVLDPGNAAAHALRGKVLYDKGEPAEADAALREALGIDAHDPVALTKLTEAGLLHWGAEQIALVKAAVETAIARVPGDIPLRWAYRAILLEQDLAAAAREVEMQITGIEPRDGEDHRLVGIAYSELGDREAAVATFRQGLALVPNYADLHAHLGVELNLLGRHQAAEEELTKAVELDGDHAFALARLGNLLLAAGRYEDAEPYLEKAKDLWPDNPDPLLDLAEVLRMTGRPEEGLELAKEAVALQESPFAVGSRGQLYYAVGDLTRAAADLKRAVEMDPDLDWARGTLAEVYRMTGELDEAIREATKAIRPKADNRWLLSVRGAAHFAKGAYGKAEPDLRGALVLNHPDEPIDLLALVTLRNTLQRTKQAEEAVELLSAYATDESGVRPNRDPQAVVYYSEALQYVGRVEEAKDVLDQAARIWPEQASIHSALAWLESAMGRHDAALRAAQTAVDQAPTSADRLYVLGSIQRTAKESLKAVETLTRAVRLEPEAAWIWAELSIALAYVGAWDLAVEAGVEATAPGRQVTAYCEEMLAWAYRYRDEPDLPAALAAYERALELDANSAGAHSGKGDTLYAMGRIEQAHACYEKVLDLLTSNDLDRLSTKAWCLYRLGRFPEALDFYQQYLAVKRDQPGFVLFDLGLLAWAEGDDEAARLAYDNALAQTEEVEARERRRGLLDVAVRDLECDRRGNLTTREQLLSRLRGERRHLPKYEGTTAAPDPSTPE